MNKARYFMFWFYNIDLHNLDVEGLDSPVPDPSWDIQRMQFKVAKVDYKYLPENQTHLSKNVAYQSKEDITQLSEKLSNLNMKQLALATFVKQVIKLKVT